MTIGGGKVGAGGASRDGRTAAPSGRDGRRGSANATVARAARAEGAGSTAAATALDDTGSSALGPEETGRGEEPGPAAAVASCHDLPGTTSTPPAIRTAHGCLSLDDGDFGATRTHRQFENRWAP